MSLYDFFFPEQVLYGDRLADNAKAVKEYEDQQAAEAVE